MPSARRRELEDLLLVGSGAIAGALLRWQLDNASLANLLGCLILGLVLGRAPHQPRLMLMVGIGFCGSLTTFSGWILDLDRQLQAGRVSGMAQNLLVDLLVGLLALLLGLGLGRLRLRR